MRESLDLTALCCYLVFAHQGASGPRKGIIPPWRCLLYLPPTLFSSGEADRGLHRRSESCLFASFPRTPTSSNLKKQARTLLRDALACEPAAAARFSVYNITMPPKLADALHVIAREYGFDTWPRLKLHLESASANPVEALSAAIQANDAGLVRQVLARHAELRSSINEPLPKHSFDASRSAGRGNQRES